MYELAFLLFRVKEAAQVEDDGQKEHEAGHSDDRHRLLTGDGTSEITPKSAGQIHRILYVNAHSGVLLHAAVQLIQFFVSVLTVFAQLCIVPLLRILLKAGESLVEGGHVVQRVVGQALESFSDTVVTVCFAPKVL